MTENPTLANMVEAIDDISEPDRTPLIVAAFESLSNEEFAERTTAAARSRARSPTCWRCCRRTPLDL